MSVIVTIWFMGDPEKFEELLMEPQVRFWRVLDSPDKVGWGA